MDAKPRGLDPSILEDCRVGRTQKGLTRTLPFDLVTDSRGTGRGRPGADQVGKAGSGPRLLPATAPASFSVSRKTKTEESD